MEWTLQGNKFSSLLENSIWETHFNFFYILLCMHIILGNNSLIFYMYDKFLIRLNLTGQFVKQLSQLKFLYLYKHLKWNENEMKEERKLGFKLYVGAQPEFCFGLIFWKDFKKWWRCCHGLDDLMLKLPYDLRTIMLLFTIHHNTHFYKSA